MEVEGILQLKSSWGDGAGLWPIIAQMPNTVLPILQTLQSLTWTQNYRERRKG